ncbi:hypothetical protein ICJ04_12875 [Stenotrophomonas sp. 169]|jgi:hypothetical protein|uniref:hypothetical protein n=1 Tax=Stenotrophomonas sp. 169 TaxID=2770322 RepID=UPI0016624BAF|nr:hypothetical protein [Stenotrophomonas sp. 169]QNR96410.1 hypothetical protein ICJ04_12875 [Stenotrophomonas sp. 169]
MNHLKTLVAAAALAFTFAIPAANAQPAQERGVSDCAVKLASCLAEGGGAVNCAIEFVKCLTSDSASTSIADRRED